MKFTTARKRWLGALVIWAVFIVSVSLRGRYGWLDTVWVVAIWLAVLTTVVNFAVDGLRYKHRTEIMWDRGYPRWFTRFAFDEDEKENAAPERRNSSGPTPRI